MQTKQAQAFYWEVFPNTLDGNKRFYTYTGIGEHILLLSSAELITFCLLVQEAES